LILFKKPSHHRYIVNLLMSFAQQPVNTSPLLLDLSHEWDDETDSAIKSAISCFLTSDTTLISTTAQETANKITLAFEPEHNIDGFRDGVEDICIYISRFLPANHISQDRLVQVIQALRDIAHRDAQPHWSGIFQTSCYSLVEAEGGSNFVNTEYPNRNTRTDKQMITIGAQDLTRLDISSPPNVTKRLHLRNLHAFMARLTRDEISNCSYQALCAFTRALEKTDPTAETRTMDMQILYDWLRLAESKLMDANLKGARVGGELWDVEAKPGFSHERWQFWRMRLRNIEEDEGYETEARESARKAKTILYKMPGGSRFVATQPSPRLDSEAQDQCSTRTLN
jgi:hypothetical protein